MHYSFINGAFWNLCLPGCWFISCEMEGNELNKGLNRWHSICALFWVSSGFGHRGIMKWIIIEVITNMMLCMAANELVVVGGKLLSCAAIISMNWTGLGISCVANKHELNHEVSCVTHYCSFFATQDAHQSKYHTTNGKLKHPKLIWEYQPQSLYSWNS